MTFYKKSRWLFRVSLLLVIPICLHSNKRTSIRLVDITEKAGIRFVHNIGDNKLSNIVESTAGGVCVFDYNNDNLPDLYFVNGSYLKGITHPRGRKRARSLTNRLYKNNGNGSFTDVTVQSGTGDRGYGMAAVAADYDNDGDRDLLVTNYGKNVLYQNQGDGTFKDISVSAGLTDLLWSTGASFFDFDNDGHLDIFIGGYLIFDPGYKNYFAAEAFPGPLAYAGQRDLLYRNNGDGTFTEISALVGITSKKGRAMGVSTADITGDGYADIFVANDGMENFLYENVKGRSFKETALMTGLQFGQNGEATSAMGPEIGDYNGDGKIDVLVPDMRYSCLYTNTGKGFFSESSAETGIAIACGQYTSWSGNFFDFDCDGDIDIFISNGDSHHLEPEEDLLLLNEMQGKLTRFVNISAELGPDFKQKFVGRGSAVLDVDNDGDLDIAVLNLNARPRLLENRNPKEINWIRFDLTGTVSNRDAIGAVVTVKTASIRQLRIVVSSSGYLSQSDHRVHFGTGASKQVDSVEIRWPSGITQTLSALKVNRTYTVKEPAKQLKAVK